LEILEDRIGRKSSIIVSQIPINKWHQVIGDPTIADAICDRIIHNSHRIELKGESVRKIYANRIVEQVGNEE
jgi:DNA replication protein DnaC